MISRLRQVVVEHRLQLAVLHESRCALEQPDRLLLDRVRIGQVLLHERGQLVARMRFERRAYRSVDVSSRCDRNASASSITASSGAVQLQRAPRSNARPSGPSSAAHRDPRHYRLLVVAETLVTDRGSRENQTGLDP